MYYELQEKEIEYICDIINRNFL